MRRRPPGSTRTAPRFPNTTLCQSARFRIYGCNARGDIVRELTGADSNAEIEWSVELANQKAAWYGFQLALDIPEANYAPPTTLRNPGVADRRRRSEEHTSELQSLMRNSYAVFCLKKNTHNTQ